MHDSWMLQEIRIWTNQDLFCDIKSTASAFIIYKKKVEPKIQSFWFSSTLTFQPFVPTHGPLVESWYDFEGTIIWDIDAMTLCSLDKVGFVFLMFYLSFFLFPS